MKHLICAALLLALAACDEKPKEPVYLGYVEGERITVAAPESGWIEEVYVGEGDAVVAGQKLFRLEARREAAQRDAAKARLDQSAAELADLLTGKRADEIRAVEAQVAQAEANLGLAQRERVRQQELSNSPAANPQRLDQARSNFEAERARLAELQAQLRVARLPAREDQIAAARAQMEASAAALTEAEVRLGDRTIAARAGGQVERLVRRTGDLAPAGGAVVTLVPPEGIHVRIYAPEADLASLRIGSRLAVSCDGCARALTAEVSFVAGEAEFTPPVIYAVESRKKLVYLVKARPSAPGLKPGQPIEARPIP